MSSSLFGRVLVVSLATLAIIGPFVAGGFAFILTKYNNRTVKHAAASGIGAFLLLLFIWAIAIGMLHERAVPRRDIGFGQFMREPVAQLYLLLLIILPAYVAARQGLEQRRIGQPQRSITKVLEKGFWALLFVLPVSVWLYVEMRPWLDSYFTQYPIADGRILENIDVIGRTRTFSGEQPSLDACSKECLANTSCQAFSYNKTNRFCYLIDGVSSFNKDPSFASARVR
jgi:hypothetical protein